MNANLIYDRYENQHFDLLTFVRRIKSDRQLQAKRAYTSRISFEENYPPPKRPAGRIALRRLRALPITLCRAERNSDQRVHHFSSEAEIRQTQHSTKNDVQI